MQSQSIMIDQRSQIFPVTGHKVRILKVEKEKCFKSNLKVKESSNFLDPGRHCVDYLKFVYI